MNKKQGTVLLLGIAAVVLIVIFTPRYKITWMDSENFIKTEQSSPLYKRSSGKALMHWDRIGLYGGAVLALCGLLIALLKERKPIDGRR